MCFRSNWSLGVHILRDIAEIGRASQNWMNMFSFSSSETPEMGTETFRTVTIVFSTPENLLVGISGAQGMKERHFLSKNMCFRKCSRSISEHWWMLELSNLCHCVQHPWKLTSRDFWSSRNERKGTFSAKTCVLRKCCGVSQKWWMPELSNLCHCVQHPWKLTSRDDWSSRNKGKPLSKLKHVFRKCSGVSLWMLELSNFFHCVQHPWKLTSRDYWSSRNKGKSLSKLKHVFRKCSGVSQNTANARAFKPLPLCSAPLKTY